MRHNILTGSAGSAELLHVADAKNGIYDLTMAPAEGIILMAMLITTALVGAMLFVYAKGIIKVTAKFKGVITAAFIGVILAGIIFMILSIIPAVRGSELFMLADFDTIEKCVQNKVDKKYEWMAAWGLAYTILYIYFKILQIILEVLGSSKSSNS